MGGTPENARERQGAPGNASERQRTPNYLILPHQTHLAAENALYLPKKCARSIELPFFATPDAPRSRKCLIFTYKMRQIYRITFFCHTRRTSQPKMPYIYLKSAPDLFRYLFLPHQTHLAAENALYLPKKR